ncbi:uncharacterized protein LOC128756117 isoform X1 [Synchiropus splendidus]|uniref:uncharacterized protein LOC128756117 isoform X1 n=1 Tax=Synchiropus splendidus TaxID=270530 RepID=UPI00237E0DF0|nr:uncharacterized protein LOC128756117 isoform X1 [Synchiropus splendidus]
MIRLGVHISPTDTVWIKPRKFDYSDFSFSPPSVSLSLKEDRLLVEVQFPCAASRRCSQTDCCRITQLIDPWTTVTVYNNLNLSESQVLHPYLRQMTLWSQEVRSHIEFAGLSPGQNYCAVANFSFPTFAMAASPRSAPECVQTTSKVGLIPALVLGAGICSVVFGPLVTMFPYKPRRSTLSEPQPKTQAADPIPTPALGPVDLTDVHLEFTDDLTSTQQDPTIQLKDVLLRSQQDPTYWHRLQANPSIAVI